MGQGLWRAAVLAALLLPGSAFAQDVTLTARDGSLSVEGTLQGFDGEFYRIETAYGLLTVDGEGVICAGPACPDMTAPLAIIRILGAPELGPVLLPGLWERFARSRGLVARSGPSADGFAMELTDPAKGATLAKISFAPASPEDGRAALIAGRAELMIAANTEPGLGDRVVALDAMIPIVALGNAVPRISTVDLARVLSGEVANWADIGGPDMPLVVHALEPDTSLQRALDARLGRPVAAAIRHRDPQALAAAVARDPWAVALTGRAVAGDARALPLTDSCGFPLVASPLAIKAEDYPLALPVYLLTPRRRLPLLAREFLQFLVSPEAQEVVAAAGYVDRAPERQPLTADGLRLINAIRAAGSDVALEDLKRVADAMSGADRLSLTFRFEDGAATLDPVSEDNVRRLADLLSVGAFAGQDLVLAGFSDGSGDAKANLALSRDRAETVAALLARAVTDLPEAQRMPRVEAFGEALPMACDTTSGGRRMNRRVELWLRPATDSPDP